MAFRTLALALCALAVAAAPAMAHPHVWVGMRASFILNNQGLITGIRDEWHFDKGYTESALQDMDTNHDGQFSDAELRPLTEENLKALREYNYFTMLRQSGKPVPLALPVAAGQVWSKGLLSLHFTLPLKAPIDPRAGEVVAKIYDPDFFISYTFLDKDPVSVEGGMPAGCTVSLKPVPTDAELNATRTMLASKGLDWQPENNEDFGALFAQPMILSCAS